MMYRLVNMSPALWSRIIRESMKHLDLTIERFAERLGRGRSTISAWLAEKRTPPMKRLGSIQLRLLELGVPHAIVYPNGEGGPLSPLTPSSPILERRKHERRKQPALRDVFRVIDKMLARQNEKMTAELKNALAKLLRVEVNELSSKK